MATPKPTNTPGPWQYECTNAGEIGSKDRVRVEAADGHIAIACRIKRTEKNTFGNVGVRRGLHEVKANARLMAAAPDLLEALRAAIGVAGLYATLDAPNEDNPEPTPTYGRYLDALRRARVAIVKAGARQ